MSCGKSNRKSYVDRVITPARLPDLLKHPKAMQAMMQMKKPDIAVLERAAAQS